jgi:antitoxin HigA-1
MELYKVVGMDGEVLETNVTLHPGEVLGEELDAREILKKDFAGALGIKTQYLRDIVKGKKNVTDRMALKLEKELGHLQASGFACKSLTIYLWLKKNCRKPKQ